MTAPAASLSLKTGVPSTMLRMGWSLEDAAKMLSIRSSRNCLQSPVCRLQSEVKK